MRSLSRDDSRVMLLIVVLLTAIFTIAFTGINVDGVALANVSIDQNIEDTALAVFDINKNTIDRDLTSIFLAKNSEDLFLKNCETLPIDNMNGILSLDYYDRIDNGTQLTTEHIEDDIDNEYIGYRDYKTNMTLKEEIKPKNNNLLWVAITSLVLIVLVGVSLSILFIKIKTKNKDSDDETMGNDEKY